MSNRTPWVYLREYPPIYVRLLAKHPGSGVSAHLAITDEEIAIASGMTIDRVREISRMNSWDPIPWGEIRRFTLACKFDPTNPVDRRRAAAYEIACKTRNKTPFQYLRNSPKFESQFLPLLQKIPQVLSQQRGASELLPSVSRPKRSPFSRGMTDAT